MKKIVIKKIFVYFFALIPFFMLLTVCAFFKHTPDTFIYTSSSDRQKICAVVQSESAEQTKQLAKYKHLKDIPVENSFEYLIKTDGEVIILYDIYQNPLYIVNASLSEFPQSDAELLESGMKVTGRELNEVVAYLES